MTTSYVLQQVDVSFPSEVPLGHVAWDPQEGYALTTPRGEALLRVTRDAHCCCPPGNARYRVSAGWWCG